MGKKEGRVARATEGSLRRTFESLPTLAEINAIPRGLSKLEQAGSVKREALKDAAKKFDDRELRVWRAEVKDRDEWKDRYDKKPVVATMAANPRRAEAHHIVPRGDAAVRYDVRNGITLSAESHAKVENGLLRIVGTKFFTVNGKRYIDATFKVNFEEVRK